MRLIILLCEGKSPWIFRVVSVSVYKELSRCGSVCNWYFEDNMVGVKSVVCLCLYAYLCLMSTVGAHGLFHQHDEMEEFRESFRRVMTPIMALGVIVKLVFFDENQPHMHPHNIRPQHHHSASSLINNALSSMPPMPSMPYH